jgi:hypothetical protein
MGEVLVELGLLTAAEVFAALSEQVREKIVGCFHWEHFAHEFEPAESTPDELNAYPGLPLEPLLLAGLRAHYGPDRLEPILAPFADRRPALIEDRATLTARFQFSTAEQRVLRLLGREHTLATIRAIAPIDEVRAAQMLAALVLSRNLEWHDGTPAPRETRLPEPRRPAKGVPHRTPSMPAPTASAPPSPTAPVPIPAPASAPRAGSSRSLANLRNTLARAGREIAAPLDERAAALEAERAFRQGLLCLEHAAPAGALRAFGRACALRGDEPEYRMYEAWAALLAASDDEARTVARGKATATAQSMLKRNRDSVQAHGILGQILLATGDGTAAAVHFRAVLHVAPEDRDAQRALRTIERRRPGSG